MLVWTVCDFLNFDHVSTWNCLFSGNIILFIDEVHTLIGSGTVGRANKGSGLDIANLLKPSLGRSEFQVKSL